MLGRRYADNTSEQSVATQLRRRRFEVFLRMLEAFPHPVRVLDVGGRPQYWQSMLQGRDLQRVEHITLLNVTAYPTDDPRFTSVAGDGRRMPQFADGEFDIVFSNSTIEHVGTVDDQQRMANEVRRIGRAYCVQTPNFYFPIEPHFLVPFFQFLPVSFRVWLVQRFALGWYAAIPDKDAAFREVDSIRLLTRSRMRSFFPEAQIFEERYLGLVKSFVAYRGPLNSAVPRSSVNDSRSR